jgi:hypothetical protein
MKKPTNQQSVAILVCRRAFRSHTDERNAVRKALAPLIVPDRVASVNDKQAKSAAPLLPFLGKHEDSPKQHDTWPNAFIERPFGVEPALPAAAAALRDL